MVNIQLQCGTMQEAVSIAEKNLIGVVEPKKLVPPDKEGSEMIYEAITHPIGCPLLEELIDPSSRISIIIDDITRPTPTKNILEVLLKYLATLVIPPEQINITIGNGLHRKTTREEKIKMVGEEMLAAFDVVDNEARDPSQYTYLGTTSHETPVWVNNRIMTSDLVITCGIIKSHGFAGFTGGAKSILPGVSNRETILSNHRFDFIEYPKGIVGSADHSATRKDMEEAARMLPVFIINVVLDFDKNLLGVFAGDVVKAHRAGVALFQQMAEVEVQETADVVIVEGGFSASINLYQALYGVSVAMHTRRPALKKGGMIILYAPCDEGIGAKIVEDMVPCFCSAEEILEELRCKPTREEQWAVQHIASSVVEGEVALVSRGLGKEVTEQLKLHYYASTQQALDAAYQQFGSELRILVIKNPDFLITNVCEEFF